MSSTNALKRMSDQESESLWKSGEVVNGQESLFLIKAGEGRRPLFFFKAKGCCRFFIEHLQTFVS